MRQITGFARENGFKALPGSSIVTLSKDKVKFRITRQAENKYKLTISERGDILTEPTYHTGENEVIDEIKKFISRW